MTEIIHQPCPYPDCNSSDGFSYNSTKMVGHCHSCDTPYPSSNKMHEWAKEKYPIKNKKGLGLVSSEREDFMEYRGITSSTYKFYKCLTQFTGDTPTSHSYVYPSGKRKIRSFPKTFVTDPGFRTDEFFGMNIFNGGSAQAVTITEGECFTPDAEVLTPKGWVSFENLSDTDNVMQVCTDGFGEWVKPTAYVDKFYSGNLVEYASGSYYSLTTENHNLIRNHPKEGYKKYKAGVNSFFSIPRTVDMAGWCGYTFEQMQLWIMLSADFTFRESGDIYGAFKKERKVSRLKTLLDSYGVRYSCNAVSGGYTSVFIHRGHNLDFAQKDLPWSMVWSHYKHDLLKEIIFWDGNYVKGKKQAEFASNRKHNAEVVQALSHSCGYVSTIIPRSNQWGSWLKVSILFNKTYSTTQKGFTKIPYEGRVMCVQVPSGMILVRQKGSVSISGNCDAMSAFQMLGSKYPCVSLPSATPKSTIIANCKPWLDSFDKIYLSLDTDDKAEKFATALMQLYPGKVYKVSHDKYKDANEFLQAGAAQSYKNAWYNARLYTPSNIINSPEAYLKLYEDTPEHIYVPTGISDLDDKILGLMQGHFTVLLAETGIGKTELMRKLEYNILKNYPSVRIATWHLEETKLRSLLGLVSYELNDNLTRRDLIEHKGKDQQVREAIKKLSDNSNYIQFSLPESGTTEDLVEQIRVLKAVYGCQYVFFEPIQDVLSISDEGEKESKLASLAIQLSKMANELNIGIVTIAHTNENGDAKYCKMISQRASVRIELKRDKEADNELDRNTLKMYVTKNRPCSVEGPAGELVFDLNTFTLKDKEEGF